MCSGSDHIVGLNFWDLGMFFPEVSSSRCNFFFDIEHAGHLSSRLVLFRGRRCLCARAINVDCKLAQNACVPFTSHPILKRAETAGASERNATLTKSVTSSGMDAGSLISEPQSFQQNLPPRTHGTALLHPLRSSATTVQCFEKSCCR